MRKTARNITCLLAMSISLLGCGDDDKLGQEDNRPQMLIYCGITMAHPIKEIAERLEPELGVRILVTQGGSEDLYQSLKAAKKGDLYLPGSASYRIRHEGEGLLGNFVHVGYNQAAMMVAKGNPKGLDNNLNNLTRSDLKVVIGAPESGSIGRETKRILDAAGIYDQVRSNIVYLSTDSRNINYSLKQGDADVTINWRATAFFEENKPHIQAIDLPPALAKPKKLLLNKLTFTKLPAQVDRFMAYAASAEGQAIFRKHGFLDNSK